MFIQRGISAEYTPHFEESYGGAAIQLIDREGHLIEWQALGYSFVDVPNYWLNKPERSFADGDREYFDSDTFVPEPYGLTSMSVLERPTDDTPWIQTCDSLAIAGDGRLYEIRSVFEIYGSIRQARITPKEIPFPPGAVRWGSIASAGGIRTGITDAGHLWVWGSPTNHIPDHLHRWARRMENGIIGTIGTNFWSSAVVGPGLEMFRVPPPDTNTRFVKVRFGGNGSGLPQSDEGCHPPSNQWSACYRVPFLALTTQGDVYQYGGSLDFYEDPETNQLAVGSRNPHDSPGLVPRPPDGSRWADGLKSFKSVLLLSESGDLHGWGDNRIGQLGLGTTPIVTSPSIIPKPNGVTSWTRFTSVYGTTFALSSSGELYACGDLELLTDLLPASTRFATDRDGNSHIVSSLTKLSFAESEERITDFECNADSLIVLFESGRYRQHGFLVGSAPHPGLARESAFPDGILEPTTNRQPFVSPVSPDHHAHWQDDGLLTVIAHAHDVDGSIASVELRSNGERIGEMTLEAGFFVYKWKDVTRGRHELTFNAVDNEGATQESDPVVLHVETERPAISGMERGASGNISFDITYTEWGSPIEVDSSTDLKIWTRVLGGSLHANPTRFIETNPDDRQRYYRIRVAE